jgi:hypothetical protein
MSCRFRSWAGCIINMFGVKFSLRTGSFVKVHGQPPIIFRGLPIAGTPAPIAHPKSTKPIFARIARTVQCQQSDDATWLLEMTFRESLTRIGIVLYIDCQPLIVCSRNSPPQPGELARQSISKVAFENGFFLKAAAPDRTSPTDSSDCKPFRNRLSAGARTV